MAKEDSQRHNLKVWPEYFKELADGKKTFEIRINDRNFLEGDILILQEFDPETKIYSGNYLEMKIGYIMKGGIFGVKKGYVVMSLIDPRIEHMINAGMADALKLDVQLPVIEASRDYKAYMIHLLMIAVAGYAARLKRWTSSLKGISHEFPALFDEKRKFPAFLPTTTAFNNVNDSNNLINKTGSIKAEVVEPKKRKNPAFVENVDLLKKCGVGEPTLSRLANLEHVNPEYLEMHIRNWRKENGRPGILIHRIRSKDPKPDSDPLRSSEESRRKYLDGEFSDFIEH